VLHIDLNPLPANPEDQKTMIARRLLDQGNLKIARHDIVDPRNRLIEARLEQLLEKAERQALPSRPLLDY
jgi:hypothetical protein